MNNNTTTTNAPPVLNPDFDDSIFNQHVLSLAMADPDEEEEVSGEELLNMQVEYIPTLLDPILQQVGLACLAGSSDTGKSSLLRQLAIAVASGDEDFLGFPINPVHRSVIYVSTEDDKTATGNLMSKQGSHLSAPQVRDLRFIFNFNNLPKKLDKKLSQRPADLVIIDCYADCFIGDLKDTQKIRQYLNVFQVLAAKHQCLFLFLHHTAKRTEDLLPSKNNLLSGQGFEGKMRIVIELRNDLMNPTIKHLCIVKGNYLPQSLKRDSFVLHFDEQHLRFTNTNERVPFEDLKKKDSEKEDEDRELYEQAAELNAEGYSYSHIAGQLKISKTKVSRLFEQAKTKGWTDNSI
jgi:RecA-family ATPase